MTWQSPSGANNFQSDGRTLDSSFEFLLGAFPADFTPSRENLDEWVDHFVPLGDPAPYLEDSQRFTKTANLSNNNSPFERTNRVYIWGRNGLGDGAEWILMSRPVSEWEWPVGIAGGIPTPGGPEYRVADVMPADLVYGSINENGALMRTEAVSFPLSYSDWVAGIFSAGESSAPDDDPDLDGKSNLLEFASGTDPKTRDGLAVLRITSERELIIQRAPNRQVIWIIENSDNLQGFLPMTSGLEITSESPEELIFRLTGTQLGRQFFRARANLPASN